MNWLPIETAPINPFDADKWYMSACGSVLLWNGHYCELGTYGYTRKGKGRWQSHRGIVCPTHWMPLPPPPNE